VAAANQIAFSRGADWIQLKSGVGIPEMNQKVEPHTGFQVNLRSEATGRRFSHRQKKAVKNHSV
jgi:hypothetical protein